MFKLFTNRNVRIMERTSRKLEKHYDFHDAHIATLEAQIKHAEEQLRQHREARAALADALSTLRVSDEFAAIPAHELLAEDMRSEIEAAQQVVVRRDPDGVPEVVRAV